MLTLSLFFYWKISSNNPKNQKKLPRIFLTRVQNRLKKIQHSGVGYRQQWDLSQVREESVSQLLRVFDKVEIFILFG